MKAIVEREGGRFVFGGEVQEITVHREAGLAGQLLIQTTLNF